jgi:hypothetical protein
MPLIQITDAYNEPLDLWLSPNHEGQTRFVRESDVPSVVTDEANLAQDGDERLPRTSPTSKSNLPCAHPARWRTRRR